MQVGSRFDLPVAVIGAGPIGLSAAAHLLRKGLVPIIFESGEHAGSHVARWGHVRMFSPWSYNLDPVAVGLLAETQWKSPSSAIFPTGAELLSQYVLPLADHPLVVPHLHLNTRVTHVSRLNHDILRTDGRGDSPFVLRVVGVEGERDVLARAVVDASGTYQNPNWLGAHGIPALGEAALADRISYGVPNILGAEKSRYADKSVLVVGGGHSAFNALQDLAHLSQEHKETKVHWGVRTTSIRSVIRSPENDRFQERHKLEVRIQHMLEAGIFEVLTGFEIQALRSFDDGIEVRSSSYTLPRVDRIIAATGFRPDLGLLSELRTSLDAGTQSPSRLAPLIDPNMHSRELAAEHGIAELTHPEIALHIVGIKSYGRAPAFLLRTGYKQVSSVVAGLANSSSFSKHVPAVMST